MQKGVHGSSSRKKPALAEEPTSALGGKGAAIVLRNEALVQLYESGITVRELVSLQLADVSLDRGDVMLRHGSSLEEWRGLPGGAVKALQSWMAVRGGNPGPLFLSALGGGGLTVKGVGFTLWRHRKQSGIRTNPMSRQLESRNLVLSLLHEAGLTGRDLASLRVEDVGEYGVRRDGAAFDLTQKVLSVLRVWIGRRTSGPVFLSQSGKGEAMTSAGIRWVLLQLGVWKKPPVQRRRLRRGHEAQQPQGEIWTEKRAACRLWEELPPSLRRRAPSGFDEENLIVSLVMEALGRGVLLEDALRITGLSLQQFHRLHKRMIRSEARIGQRSLEELSATEQQRLLLEAFSIQ